MRQTIILLAVIPVIALGFVLGCSNSEQVKKIDLSKREVPSAQKNRRDSAPVRIAVGGMITPKEGFTYYRRLLDYIEGKLGREVTFVDREDYGEINKLLKQGKIDVAFVCGGPYVDGHKEFGMELLVAPRAYGGTVYYSYILAHKDSPLQSLDDLKGKSFAFTDPLSNTGKLVPTYMLARMGETPESFFSNYEFTYAHDTSIRAVAEGLVDASAVDSLIWEYGNSNNPEYTSRTKILKKSEPYGIPPVVVRPGLDRDLTEKLKYIFLNIHRTGEGAEILRGMMIEKFVLIQDSDYDSIRNMKQWIAGQKPGLEKSG